jgi:adenosylhomocysteine nucleosidase
MVELPSTLVVFALRSESAGVFEAAQVPVLYCGVGKVNAAIALTRELCRYGQQSLPMPRVLNFGSVGSRQYRTGTLVESHEFVQRDMDVRGLGIQVGVTPFDEAPACALRSAIRPPSHGGCGSGDSFATGEIGMECAVVDMEAYALAKVCWLEKAPFAARRCERRCRSRRRTIGAVTHKAADEFLTCTAASVRP